MTPNAEQPCKAAHGAVNRELIGGLFLRGMAQAAARHRRAICNSASDCGLWCAMFIKGVGTNQVQCYDMTRGQRMDLMAALNDPEAKCPRGLW